MTLQQRLEKAHQDSVALYIRRQQIELQRQQIQNTAAQIDRELTMLDGELRVLTELRDAEQKSERHEPLPFKPALAAEPGA